MSEIKGSSKKEKALRRCKDREKEYTSKRGISIQKGFEQTKKERHHDATLHN